MALSMKSIVVVGDRTHVVVIGDIHWPELASFRAGLDLHLRRSADIVLNLSALRSWSLSAQAVLVGALRAARREGRTVVLRGLHGSAASQLQQSGLVGEMLKATGVAEPAPIPAQREARTRARARA
ncbi:MAG TPA: STAS domain-containing protein [Candidatus Eisenbacteria bacterium]|nr:STAS domain-containing protein [Candidatus Eisenbacteria bacterium]